MEVHVLARRRGQTLPLPPRLAVRKTPAASRDLMICRNWMRNGVNVLPDWRLCSHLGQSGGEVTGLPLQQDHSDCTRVAQHALVLGSGGNVQSDPTVSAQPAQSGI